MILLMLIIVLYTDKDFYFLNNNSIRTVQLESTQKMENSFRAVNVTFLITTLPKFGFEKRAFVSFFVLVIVSIT